VYGRWRRRLLCWNGLIVFRGVSRRVDYSDGLEVFLHLLFKLTHMRHPPPKSLKIFVNCIFTLAVRVSIAQILSQRYLHDEALEVRFEDTTVSITIKDLVTHLQTRLS